MELFVRKANSQLYNRMWAALESRSNPQHRSDINVTAFRAVVQAHATNPNINAINKYVANLQNLQAAEFAELGTKDLTEVELRECADLAYRIATNLFVIMREPITLEPRFAGCGILNSCKGDALTDSIRLIELKDGDRPFRSYEFRQLSSYAALHLNSTGRLPKSLVVINSRRGTIIETEIEVFAQEVAGQSAINYLREIVRVLSDITISG